MTATIDIIEPGTIEDLSKGILVPGKEWEAWLERWDWTYHQLARSEFPAPFESLDEFQGGCIASDPGLWTSFFLREPEDPDHQDPYALWEYQKTSIRYDGHTIHRCGAEVGKTREIIAYGLYKAFTIQNGSGIIGAPQQTHLEEIIEGMYDQMLWNPELKRSLVRWKKHPHHAFYFSNKFKIDFRPSGHDGEAYRGVHARTFAIKDEAVKDKNKKQWSEFWRAMKPACVAKFYSVPDGDRSCEFYKLAQRAESTKKGEEVSVDSIKNASRFIRNIKFRLFHFPKTIMPAPYWSVERKKFFVEQYGGEDSPEYKHNVLGEDGDPENTVFPWHQFKLCIKENPDYRCMKVLVDSAHDEVMVSGYKCEYVAGESGAVPRQITLMDSIFDSTFFDLDSEGESEFRHLIKSMFIASPGFKRGGADLGFSGDPTEIIVKLILGKTERVVARLQLKHVTYDQQCQAMDAMDDLYGPDIIWGTDFGNAGSAVAHDLQGLQIYEEKGYDERLRGFMFESTSENIREDGTAVIDSKTGKPAKITLKELATDILVKKMQRQEVEYPPDPDYALFYPNHTCRAGGKHRIYKKTDDHLIDADRTQQLAQLLYNPSDDLFAVGT